MDICKSCSCLLSFYRHAFLRELRSNLLFLQCEEFVDENRTVHALNNDSYFHSPIEEVEYEKHNHSQLPQVIRPSIPAEGSPRLGALAQLPEDHSAHTSRNALSVLLTPLDIAGCWSLDWGVRYCD